MNEIFSFILKQKIPIAIKLAITLFFFVNNYAAIICNYNYSCNIYFFELDRSLPLRCPISPTESDNHVALFHLQISFLQNYLN